MRADTTAPISSTTWRTRAWPRCTPRCLLRLSSREPTLRLLCTSRTPVSFLRFLFSIFHGSCSTKRECVTSKTNSVASYVSAVRILPLCRNYQGNSSRKETIGRLFRDKERVSFRVMTALSEVYAAILYLIEKSWI